MNDFGKSGYSHPKEPAIYLSGGHPCTLSRRRQSPFFLLVIIIIAIFLAETVVMFLLSVLPHFSTTAEMLVDSFILVVLVFPLLYFFLFNPLVLHITERSQAETALKESEEKFRTICASAVDAILMMDKDGYISFWNGGAEKIFGHTSGFATGKHLHELLVPERYRESFSKGFTKFRETGEWVCVGKTLEVSALRKNSSEFPVELSVSSVKLKGQWRAIGIIKDITGRKTAQESNESQLKRLAALRAIDMTINASLDLRVTLAPR